ncbi:hypothetical protein DFH08DRAFT_709811, partial [Mycena albidolilacea]
KPWVQPAGHLAMDQHYKLLRADKEIARLNVEILRLITYMVDEERFLVYHEGQLQVEGKGKVQQVDHAHFNGMHMECLTKLSKEVGFMASLSLGVCISKECMVPEAAPSDSKDMVIQEASRCMSGVPLLQDEEDNGVDEDTDIDVEAIADAFETIVHITHDHPAPMPAL